MKFLDAQCTDVTNTAEVIFSNKNVSAYGLKVIGACIDESHTMHITISLDPEYSTALMNFGFSSERTVVIQTLEPFFTSIRMFLNKFLSVQLIRFYYVDFEKERDIYGNIISNRKNIMNSIGLKRSTADRINWEYIDENLKNIMEFGEYTELYRILDEVYVKTKK